MSTVFLIGARVRQLQTFVFGLRRNVAVATRLAAINVGFLQHLRRRYRRKHGQSDPGNAEDSDQTGTIWASAEVFFSAWPFSGVYDAVCVALFWLFSTVPLESSRRFERFVRVIILSSLFDFAVSGLRHWELLPRPGRLKTYPTE